MKLGKKVYFTALFIIIGLLALQVPLFAIKGSRTAFTLYDFLAPIAGSFIGAIPGIAAVFGVQIVNVLLHGGFVDMGSVIRLFPTLFAVWYFSSFAKVSEDRARIGNKFVLAVPLLAMLAFNLHPIGRTVWYYSLYWLIPPIMYAFRNRFLFARALGATFTAHAVGGAAWIWVFNLPATVWTGLIPQVALERSIIAVGIVISYRVMVNVLYVLVEKKQLSWPFAIEKQYVLNILK